MNAVWKFQDIYVTQILRDINFGESRSSKNDVFAIFGALDFVNLVILAFKKSKNTQKTKFKASERVEMSIFETADSPTLIPRKI